jgi:hypothetical protein
LFFRTREDPITAGLTGIAWFSYSLETALPPSKGPKPPIHSHRPTRSEREREREKPCRASHLDLHLPFLLHNPRPHSPSLTRPPPVYHLDPPPPHSNPPPPPLLPHSDYSDPPLPLPLPLPLILQLLPSRSPPIPLLAPLLRCS